MATYKDDLYFCDFGLDNLYKIAKNGMEAMASAVTVTIDGSPVGTSLDGCSDIHFYIGNLFSI